MRLQLIGALLLIAPARAGAEPEDAPTAATTLRVYADDDDMTVVSPSLSATGLTAAGVAIDLDATVDAVSGASVDVVTSASPRAIDERRVELGVAARRPLPRLDGVALSLDGRVSHEADYLALRGGVGARIEREARNLIVDLRYQLGHDRIAAVSDPTFHRTRIRHGAVVAISRILGARTVADLAIEVATGSGYHASPYRRVALIDPEAPLPTWIDEATPSRRRSAAVALRLRRAVRDGWFVSARYRLYGDDWSIASHTVDGELHHQATERLLLGVTLRGYLQDGAAFYQARYQGAAPPRWRTRDRTLGPMRTVFAALTAELAIDDGRWHVVGSLGLLSSWFLDFPSQADRHAAVTTLSLSLAW